MNSLPNSPFQSGEINSSEWSPVLHEHSAHPDTLIRTHGEFGFDEEDPIAATTEGLRESIKLFTDLENNYGIRHAGFQPVIGQLPSGHVGAYITTDKIEGHSYRPEPSQEKSDYLESLRLNPEHIPAGIALLQSLSSYWKDKVGNRDAMLTDIFSIDQYVYDQSNDKLVLVDMDPLFANETKMNDEIESQWVLTYTANKLEGLAKSLLDSHELEVWEKSMKTKSSQ